MPAQMPYRQESINDSCMNSTFFSTPSFSVLRSGHCGLCAGHFGQTSTITSQEVLHPNCPCFGNCLCPVASHPFALSFPCLPCCLCLLSLPCCLFHPCSPYHPYLLFPSCCPCRPCHPFPSCCPCPAKRMGSQHHPSQLPAGQAFRRFGRHRLFHSPYYPVVLQRKVLLSRSPAAEATPSCHLCPSVLSHLCYLWLPLAYHHQRSRCLSLSRQSPSHPGCYCCAQVLHSRAGWSALPRRVLDLHPNPHLSAAAWLEQQRLLWPFVLPRIGFSTL
mmetsp:Transcript_37376/g.86230  ORF Transcript_37376/g.86230 Transcript_37376/m.86230 type:complete len:274 (-) Transcript_37376:757-1578(-)